LSSSAGTVVATATAPLDTSGDWSGTLTVPSSASNGSYFVDATCITSQGLVTQNYASGALTVGPAPTPVPGPQGPPGPQGTPGTNGTNGTNGIDGTNGLNGAVGPTGPQGAQGGQGPAGPAGAAAPKPIGQTVKCTTTVTSLTSTSTSCTITYTYAATSAARDGRAVATARVHGKTTVVGTGRIRGHRFSLKLAHLRPGRYRLTLVELRPHHRPVVVGHTTLTVS
jgi:hypothetical protein